MDCFKWKGALAQQQLWQILQRICQVRNRTRQLQALPFLPYFAKLPDLPHTHVGVADHVG
jgi:hypothetical protein